MNTNGISNLGSTFTSTSTSYAETVSSKKSSVTTPAAGNSAAVYEANKGEKTDSSKKTYKKDSATINKLMSDLEQRQNQLKDLVEKTLRKQGQTFQTSQSIFDILKSGKVEFSSSDIATAKEDVSEEGYFGVKQTSERLYSFAFALTGGDPSKADKMMSAIEKGFKQATKSWGDELPSICKDTLEATREKIQAWKDGTVTE
ncbi:MAG: hypothetical protein RR056_02160 [Acetivibrio sp.]